MLRQDNSFIIHDLYSMHYAVAKMSFQSKEYLPTSDAMCKHCIMNIPAMVVLMRDLIHAQKLLQCR
jgi:hypothetical protein